MILVINIFDFCLLFIKDLLLMLGIFYIIGLKIIVLFIINRYMYNIIINVEDINVYFLSEKNN